MRSGIEIMIRHVAALCLTLAASLAAASPAAAQDPVTDAFHRFFSLEPRTGFPTDPRNFDGIACERALAHVPADRVWWGRFAGGKLQEGSGRGSHVVTNTDEACFPSADACEAWMYEMKSEWGYWPIHNQCRRGYDPGAPVTPWWQTRRG